MNPLLNTPDGDDTMAFEGIVLPSLDDEHPLARSSSGHITPVILGLISAHNEAPLHEALVAMGLLEDFAFKRVQDREDLTRRLRIDPTVAVLIADEAPFEAVAALKNTEALCDVPVLFVNDEASSEAMIKAIEVGCDDVAPIDRGFAPLISRLSAIWRYHRRYGFNPPSGHWMAISSTDSTDEHYPDSDKGPVLRGTRRFVGGQDGAAHIVLISNHPYYKTGGQEMLSRAGHHITFFDSGFLALHFLTALAGHKAPDIPDFLQGKLDLVIIAQSASADAALQLVRRVKATSDLSSVPILVVTSGNESLGVFSPYRARGVFTMVSPQPQPEALAFRIQEIFEHRDRPGFHEIHRYPHTARCEFRIVNEDGPGAWQPALTCNISRSSIYVRTIAPAMQDQHVELQLRLRRFGILLEFSGPVAWSMPWRPASQRPIPAGFGLSLIKGSQSDFEALVDFCDMLAEG